MTLGVCDFAAWRPGPFGYPEGTLAQNLPRFFVDHIMEGYKSTMDNLAWRIANQKAVHFGIGKDGSLSQYTNILDAAWGNGVSGDITRYDRGNRHLVRCETLGWWGEGRYFNGAPYWFLTDGVQNILNVHSISIEHEGFWQDEWTAPMLETDIAVKKWCLEELTRAGHAPLARDEDLLVGHYQIDPRDRANCPGPNWPKATILAALKEEDMPTLEEIAAAMDARRRLKMQWVKENIEEGDLVRAEDTDAVYVLIGGYLRHVPSADSAARHGLQLGTEAVIDPIGLLAFPIGMPLE